MSTAEQGPQALTLPADLTRQMWAAAGTAVFNLQSRGIGHHDKIVEAVWEALRVFGTPAPGGGSDASASSSQEGATPVALEALLKDPHAVHLNMLRGGIAKLTPAQIGHLYRGEEAEEVLREVRRQNPDSQGQAEATASKTPRDSMLTRSEAEWEALEDAVMTVYAMRAGRTLTEADAAALSLVDRCHREDDESATDAFHRGLEEGLRQRGGDELVNLEKRVSEAVVQRATERAMRGFAQQRTKDLEAVLEPIVRLRGVIEGAMEEAPGTHRLRLEDGSIIEGPAADLVWGLSKTFLAATAAAEAALATAADEPATEAAHVG